METGCFAKVASKMQKDRLKVIVKFTGRPADNDEIDRYLACVHEVYSKEIPFYILYDARDITTITSSQLWRQATFMREHDSATKRLIVRSAVVVANTMCRKMLSTLFLLKKPACPLEVFDHVENAKRFLRTGEIIHEKPE